MDTRSTPRNQESYFLWFLKILLGPLLVLLLGLHFVVNHLVAPEGLLSWQDVVAYYQNPVIPLIEVLFLIAVIAHSALGVRSILLDLNPSERQMKGIDITIILLSMIGLVYGVWLVLRIAAFA